jgi:hypothetical protein
VKKDKENKFIMTCSIPLFTRSAFAQGCDKQAALDFMTNILGLAKWHVKDDRIAVHWAYRIENCPAVERLKILCQYGPFAHKVDSSNY